VWAIKKFGLGVWLWTIKGGMSTELKDSMEDTFQNMSGKRAVIAESDKVNEVQWIGPNQTGIAGVVQASDFILGLIAAGSGIPKDIYTGVSAGAITGSEINNKALYATISKIQSDVTPYVLETIRRMGYDIDDMVIEWNTRYATDELEQAQIRQLNADAHIKEKQAEDGDPLTNFSKAFGGGGGNQPALKDQTQNNNPAGVRS